MGKKNAPKTWGLKENRGWVPDPKKGKRNLGRERKKKKKGSRAQAGIIRGKNQRYTTQRVGRFLREDRDRKHRVWGGGNNGRLQEGEWSNWSNKMGGSPGTTKATYEGIKGMGLGFPGGKEGKEEKGAGHVVKTHGKKD